MLGLKLLKGDASNLDGRLTVYARVDVDPADFDAMKHPVASMIHNGLLVAQGNYRDQYSLRDFLRLEMGVSLEDGIEQLLSRLDGIESALDPEKLKEKMHEMEGMEEMIPTPAKLVAFHSEAEVIEQEGDVFCAGTFRNIGNAVLSVNAFPILYQARYREQALLNVRLEIERMISQVEVAAEPETCRSAGVDVSQRLMKDFFPRMLYCRRDRTGLDAAEKQFRDFMQGYPLANDIRAVVEVFRAPYDLGKRHYQLLELYAQRMAAVCRGDEVEADHLARAITNLETGATGAA